MLYRYKPTGALLEKVSVHGDGIVMCTDCLLYTSDAADDW